MSLHPLRRKDLLQTLDLDLPLMLLSLTVLGVSITYFDCQIHKEALLDHHPWDVHLVLLCSSTSFLIPLQ